MSDSLSKHGRRLCKGQNRCLCCSGILNVSFLPIRSLVCAVSYTTQYGEKLYFRKFFKFQVRDVCAFPLDDSGVSLGGTWEISQVLNRSKRRSPSQLWTLGRVQQRLQYGPSDSPFLPFVSWRSCSCVLLQKYLLYLCLMDAQCEKTTAFSLQSILNQVLKPLDVKTKFYNAEVRVPLSNTPPFPSSSCK